MNALNGSDASGVTNAGTVTPLTTDHERNSPTASSGSSRPKRLDISTKRHIQRSEPVQRTERRTRMRPCGRRTRRTGTLSASADTTPAAPDQTVRARRSEMAVSPGERDRMPVLGSLWPSRPAGPGAVLGPRRCLSDAPLGRTGGTSAFSARRPGSDYPNRVRSTMSVALPGHDPERRWTVTAPTGDEEVTAHRVEVTETGCLVVTVGCAADRAVLRARGVGTGRHVTRQRREPVRTGRLRPTVVQPVRPSPGR